MGDSTPINAGFLIRALIISFVWIRTNRYLRRLWKPQVGMLSVWGYCIKIKCGANLAEAHAIQFVARHTSIPVPKIYSAFVSQDITYIVMTKIEGQMAWLDWPKRSEASRDRVLNQLCGMVSQLRSIPPPDGTGVCNVDGGPIRDCRLPAKLLWGPFATVRDFHKELANGADLETSYTTDPPDFNELLDFYRGASDEVAFTHGDLNSMNVLVRGDDVVGIIDWETAGWLPSYWEYTSAWFVNPYNTSWEQEVDKFITPMPHELKMEQIRQKYFPGF